MVNNLPASAGDMNLIPGLGRSPGEGNGNPLQYSCLENPMDRGACWATDCGVTKSRARLAEHTHSTHLSPDEPDTLQGVKAWDAGGNTGDAPSRIH